VRPYPNSLCFTNRPALPDEKEVGSMVESTQTRPSTGAPSGSDGDLVTERGRTAIADSVVSKIAGIAAREISGVHNMGTGAARAVGAIVDRLPVGGQGGQGSGAGQGVKVEVGERQAAVDLDLVVDYGVSIVDVAEAVRGNVISKVERMTGLQVTEVNVSVDDIWLGDEEESQEEPRVQ
jgi:uncharacterized alkaline shock family protein YloU